MNEELIKHLSGGRGLAELEPFLPKPKDHRGVIHSDGGMVFPDDIADEVLDYFWKVMMWSDLDAVETMLALRDRLNQEVADIYNEEDDDNDE